MNKGTLIIIAAMAAAICGKAEQVVFPLDLSPLPRTPAPSETVVADPAWYGAASATVSLDGTELYTVTGPDVRTVDMSDLEYGLHALTYAAGNETLTAQYEKPFPPPTVSNLSARQRYPWNGLVDIECDIAYSDANADLEVSVVATNMATGAALPVRTIHVADGGGMTVKAGRRHFIWNFTADVGAVKIDDIALNVTAGKSLGGVQLWENGPYWAECNVGATKPEEYGYYFWWGDTVGYRRNSANNGLVSVKDGMSFSFSSGNCPTYNKNTLQLQSLGYIDASGNLVAAHDAATAHLGAPWRMPTDAEWSALISNCTTTWTTRNGVYGRLVTGKGAYASKSIFLPAAGYGDDSDLDNSGSDGGYWSSTPYSDISFLARDLYFNSGNFGRSSHYRYRGQSVRPLRVFAQ